MAFIVFGITITAAVKVLHDMAELNYDIVHRSAMSKRAQSLMTQIMHEAPVDGDFVREETIDLDEETEAQIIVSEYETTDDDENILSDMYLIEVTVRSKIDPSEEPQVFSIIHYRNVYGNPSL